MKKKRRIAQAFQCWLSIVIIIAFLVTTGCLWVIQTKLSEESAINLLALNIADVLEDIRDASDENLIELAYTIGEDLNNAEAITSEFLMKLTKKYDVTEINHINNKGIIDASTYPNFMNYDMLSGEQSSEFMVLLSGEKEYVQSYGPVSYDASILRKYGGVTLADGGFVQVGYGSERFQKDIDEFVVGVTRNRHVGKDGSVIIVNETGNIVSDRKGNEGKSLDTLGIVIDESKTMPDKVFVANVYGERCYCMYEQTEGYLVLAVMPTSEASLSRNISVGVTTSMQILIFVALFVLIKFV